MAINNYLLIYLGIGILAIEHPSVLPDMHHLIVPQFNNRKTCQQVMVSIK